MKCHTIRPYAILDVPCPASLIIQKSQATPYKLIKITHTHTHNHSHCHHTIHVCVESTHQLNHDDEGNKDENDHGGGGDDDDDDARRAAERERES